MRITRAVCLALEAWTRTNDRAANDYAEHPNSACRIDGCDHLAADDLFCNIHRRANDAANQRMRLLRATRKAKP